MQVQSVAFVEFVIFFKTNTSEDIQQRWFCAELVSSLTLPARFGHPDRNSRNEFMWVRSHFLMQVVMVIGIDDDHNAIRFLIVIHPHFDESFLAIDLKGQKPIVVD